MLFDVFLTEKNNRLKKTFVTGNTNDTNIIIHIMMDDIDLVQIYTICCILKF